MSYSTTGCGLPGQHFGGYELDKSTDRHSDDKGMVPQSAQRWIIGGVVLCGFMAVTGCRGRSSPKGQVDPQLSQEGLQFATRAVMDDIDSGLSGARSQMTQPHLLSWAKLDIQTNAIDYEAAYDDNEIHADDTFKNKKILVSGTVAQIEKDFTGSGYIGLATHSLVGVHALLSPAGSNAASQLHRGQKVQLVCVGSGRILTISTLTDCDLMDDYLNSISGSIQSKIENFLQSKAVLTRAEAEAIVSVYLLGSNLPKHSECLQAVKSACSADIKVLGKDPGQQQALRTKANEMLSALKVQK